MLDLIKYYVDLLIMQYKDKPRATATVSAYVKEALIDQLPKQIEQAFNIDTAVGVQLDILGKYVGVVRSAQGPDGYIILSEPDFRKLIKIGQIRNHSKATLFEIQTLLQEFFPGQIYVYDYLNMRMSYIINSSAITSDLVQMMIIQNLLPYPMAIGRGSVIYYPVLNDFFGFCTYEFPVPYNNTPFNDYNDYQMDWPWLDYDYALNPDLTQNYSLLTQVDLDKIVQENLDMMWV